MGGGGFGLDSANRLFGNRRLLKNKQKFKENFQAKSVKHNQQAKVSQDLGTHYRYNKNAYPDFTFKLLVLVVNILIIIFIVLKLVL
jgi:hypothetical protein